MKRWVKTIDIKQHLNGKRDAATAAFAGRAIADEIERGVKGQELDDAFWTEELIDTLREIRSVQQLNCTLVELYDWADSNNIWMGP